MMRRLAALATATILLLTGCTGGGDDEKGPSIPLPDKAPSARGPVTGPALEPKVLLAATDELEEQAGALDTAQVERRSGAFVSGRTAVGYSVDDISGYDTVSGDKLWTAKLDLGGGTVCFVTQPDRAVKRFTVVYGEGSFCPHVATIRVEDGKVVKKSEALGELGASFEGEPAGGTVNHLFTVKGTDFLVDMRGVVWRMSAAGDPEPVARLESDRYFALLPTPDGKRLIGSRLGSGSDCQVDAYALPSFEPQWSRGTKDLFPDVSEDCVISPAKGDPAWLAQETSDRQYLVQVDPATGEVLGRADAPKDRQKPIGKDEFDVASAALHLDSTLGLPDGEMIFARSGGITRYSLATDEIAWELSLDQLELESDEEFPLTTVLPQGVTDDGYLIASVSNGTAAEVVAVEVDSGRLVGRWAVPAEYRNGFQVDPGLTLFGDGVILTRNFEQWEYTFADYQDRKEPEGDRFDIGVFTFPEPGAAPSTKQAVPTAGPVDTEATWRGGIEAPSPDATDREAGAFTVGGTVVTHADATLTAFNAASGKKAWSTTLATGDGASVCATPALDRAVRGFVVSYREKAGERCMHLARVTTSTGKISDTAELEASTQGVNSILAHEGSMFVITGDGGVGRLSRGALTREVELDRPTALFSRAAGSDDLYVATSSIKDGKDYELSGYRLPAFQKVWSVRASKVFGRTRPQGYVVPWRGNGLMVSASFGDVSDPDADVRDAIAALDPATGKVAATTGLVKRVYGEDDLEKFSLTGAVGAEFAGDGFDDGTVVVAQSSGVVRWSLADDSIVWATDLSSILRSMEREKRQSQTAPSIHLDVVGGGTTVLATLSNDTGVELMTLKASDGTITGRWNVPAKRRNGLQTDPDVVPFKGGVALSHSDYAWDYAFAQQDREPPSTTRYDVGLFGLTTPKRD